MLVQYKEESIHVQ